MARKGLGHIAALREEGGLCLILDIGSLRLRRDLKREIGDQVILGAGQDRLHAFNYHQVFSVPRPTARLRPWLARAGGLGARGEVPLVSALRRLELRGQAR